MAAPATKVLDLTRPWFDVKLPSKQCSLKELATFTMKKEQLDELYREAQQIIDEESASRGLDDRKGWYMDQFQSRGTIGDRIAAAALKLTPSQCAIGMSAFGTLFEVARTDTHHFGEALKALAAVWPKVLPVRALKRFAAQYFATLPDDPAQRRKVLCYWFIEDHLKRTYAQFLAMAESCLKDKLLQRREAWLETIGKLLTTVAESRHVAISLVVDKLGDPMSAMAHRAYHSLLQMLCESSSNQGLLLSELEKLVFMKNSPGKAKQYGVNVMNQMVFNKDERRLALRAIGAYLGLFKTLAAAGQIDQAITGPIIVGIRRAFPYAGNDLASISEHVDALFLLAQTGPVLQRVSCLTLVHQLVATGWKKLEDRYYRSLYSLLLVSPAAMPHSSQLAGLFTLLYKTLKADPNDSRVAAFVHRLLQRCLFYGEAFACAVLMLVSEVMRHSTWLSRLVRRENAAASSSSPAAPEAKPYDPRAREPRFAAAERECVWTLYTLSRHCHPTVARFATSIIEGSELLFDVHPLDDLNMSNFLDMFVDSKARQEGDSGSGATGGRDTDKKGIPVFRRAVHVPALPSVDDKAFSRADPRHVDAAALFMHRYAHQREKFRAGVSAGGEWAAASAAKRGEKDPLALLSSSAAVFGSSSGAGVAAQEVNWGEDKYGVADKDEEEKDAAAADGMDWGREQEYDEDEAALGDSDYDEDEDPRKGGGKKAGGGGRRGGRSGARGGAAYDENADFDDMMQKSAAPAGKKRRREEQYLEKAERQALEIQREEEQMKRHRTGGGGGRGGRR